MQVQGSRESLGYRMKVELIFCGGWVVKEEGMGSAGGWKEETEEEAGGVVLQT